MTAWNTAFTRRFPCRLPIMTAPMADVSGGALAAEAVRAGALGFVAAGHVFNEKTLEALEEQIHIFRKNATDEAPLSIGWIGYSSFSDSNCFKLYEQVLRKHHPDVVQFFAPSVSTDKTSGRTNVEIAHDFGAKVMCQVGSVAEAKKAIAAGADAIIAQGSEAGGHGLRRELGSGTLPLARRLVALVAEVPEPQKPVVLAAGGISDGQGVAAALALGCDGAVLGTRLWASREALGDMWKKQQLVKASSCDDVIRTRVFDQIKNITSKTPWQNPYDTVGALRNDITDTWDGKALELSNELAKPNSDLIVSYNAAIANGNADLAQILAGQGVGEIDGVDPVYDIVTKIDQETRKVVQNLSSLLQ